MKQYYELLDKIDDKLGYSNLDFSAALIWWIFDNVEKGLTYGDEKMLTIQLDTFVQMVYNSGIGKSFDDIKW